MRYAARGLCALKSNPTSKRLTFANAGSVYSSQRFCWYNAPYHPQENYNLEPRGVEDEFAYTAYSEYDKWERSAYSKLLIRVGAVESSN